MAITVNPATGTGVSSAGNLTEAYVSAVDLAHTFDIYPEMFKRYAMPANFLTLFEDLGMYKVADQSTFYHYEENWLQQAQTVVSVSTASSRTAIVVNTDATTLTASVRVGDTLMFKGGYRGYVYSTTSGGSTSTISVVPLGGVAAATLTASITAGDQFAVYGNAVTMQGASPRESMISKPLMFSGQMQELSEQYNIKGTEELNKISFKGPDGKPYYTYIGELQAFARFRQSLQFSLLLNIASPNVTDANGDTVQFTQGLLDKIEQDGINYNMSQGGQFGITDFANVCLGLDAEFAPNEMNFYVGNELGMQVTNQLTASMRNGGVVYGNFGDKGSKRSLELGFDSFVYNGRTFHMNKLVAMYHPQVTAIPGLDGFQSGGFMIPLDKQVDASSGASINSIMLRYKAANGIDRRYKSTKIGFDITAIDKTSITHIGEMGLQVVGANRMVRIK